MCFGSPFENCNLLICMLLYNKVSNLIFLCINFIKSLLVPLSLDLLISNKKEVFKIAMFNQHSSIIPRAPMREMKRLRVAIQGLLSKIAMFNPHCSNLLWAHNIRDMKHLYKLLLVWTRHIDRTSPCLIE